MSRVVNLCGWVLFVASGAGAEDAWMKQAAAHVLTPKEDRVAPVTVTRTEGRVDASEALLAEDGKSCRLTYGKGGGSADCGSGLRQAECRRLCGLYGHGDGRGPRGTLGIRMPSGRTFRNGLFRT